MKVGANVRFWLHQSKLLEGIDDPSIVAVGILNGFSNTRQLVQQIGRAIRSTDPARRAAQIAKVIALPTLRDELYARWQRYLKYESMAAKKISEVVQSEGALPERLLQLMPAFQYVAGDFREKYLLNGNVTADGLRLSLRTTIFLLERNFDPALAEEELVEALIADDRFVPRPIEALPPEMFGRTYYGWGNSPYLARQYLTEWTLGVVLATRIGRFLFVQDTGGICFAPECLRVKRAGREELLKAFPDSTNGKTKLTRVSGNLNDMSDRSIRSQAYRTRSVEDTFTDLSDPAFVLSSAYGYVGGSGRYLGLTRARWSDASDGMVTIPDYRNWLQKVHDTLESATPRHKVFDRYAQATTVDGDEAKPISVLLDLASESFEEFRVLGEGDEGQSGGDIPYEDLCRDVNPDTGEFTLKMLEGEDIPCKLSYMPSSRRYRLQSPKLDELVPLRTRAGQPQTLTELVNREQSFRVLTSKPQVVYSGGSFYRTRDLAANGTVFALEDAHVIPCLGRAYTEKGEKLYENYRAEWERDSIFGYFHARCQAAALREQNELAKRLRATDTVLLDDGPKEICDFIALERKRRRVILVHAKASVDAHRDAVTALQIVGRQVLASLAFCSTFARVNALDPERWREPVIANTLKLGGLSRVFKSPPGEVFADTAAAVLAALANPTWNREIWIVAGRLLDVPYVRGLAVKAPTSRCRQLIMYLSSLQTACQRAGARMVTFAHANAPKPEDIPVRK